MSLAIVVVIVSRNTAGREMHQRTVNGAQRTDSSEWGFFFVGIKILKRLNQTPGAGGGRSQQSLLAAVRTTY